ncbi:MAG: fructosamine kinase family protein [Symploca sp. SIO2G7]|nr:fructosamine kinase family protein [Symploca sp. SIO2G7]
MWTEIAKQISKVTGETFEIKNRRSVGGGCINQGYCLIGETTNYFVKLNQASQIQMFEAEALGLKQMYETQTIRIPQPICVGTTADCSYIVLEWLELGGSQNNQSWIEMGRQLAAMHRATPSQESQGKFGWNENNTIGSTPQINTWTTDWGEFFAEHRIGYQLKLARRRGGNFPHQGRLLEVIPRLLEHQPQPSLVHGDLWGGNAAVTQSGEPVIFDPATYIGDREVDLAMTELFGGFPSGFYRGYNEVWPLDQGYQKRKTLYNLYHILNHFNLFGSGYAQQAARMIEQVLG